MSDYHKLLIRSTTEDQKQQDALDNLLGDAVVDRIKQWEGKLPLASAEIAGQQELTNEQREKLPYVQLMNDPRACCFVCTGTPIVGTYTWRVGNDKVLTPLCEDCRCTVGIRDVIVQKIRAMKVAK